LRGVAFGSENYLFYWICRRVVPMYSLIETAKLNGRIPEGALVRPSGSAE
jgi:hypothetical protein